MAGSVNGGPKAQRKFYELEARLRFSRGLGPNTPASRMRSTKNLLMLLSLSGETIFGLTVERPYGRSGQIETSLTRGALCDGSRQIPRTIYP